MNYRTSTVSADIMGFNFRVILIFIKKGRQDDLDIPHPLTSLRGDGVIIRD